VVNTTELLLLVKEAIVFVAGIGVWASTRDRWSKLSFQLEIQKELYNFESLYKFIQRKCTGS
jgi:hypothetical protein